MSLDGLAPGTVVAAKYVVERTLGRGGMGAVYVVSHRTTGKRLAMKCLLAEYVSSAELVSRFLREAQVMGRLQHRHVVDVFDVGRDGNVLYIVMELLDGKPLGELLHDSSLTLEEALVILLRAMEGVAAAHAQGVVHRDLKPDNIFICLGSSGRLDDPRVLDFGISKLDDGVNDPLTRTGVAMGTPFYMSIEQLKGERDLDARVDVYALGVILYEAIAGAPPHRADSMSALAIKVMTTEPVHLGVLRPDLPPGLADVIMKALTRDREGRQRSVRALIEALRPYIPKSAGLLVPEGQGRPLRTPGGPSAKSDAVPAAVARSPAAGSQRVPSAPAARGRLPSRLGLAVGLVLLGLVLTGSAAWLVLRASGSPGVAALPSMPPSPLPSASRATTPAPASGSAASSPSPTMPDARVLETQAALSVSPREPDAGTPAEPLAPLSTQPRRKPRVSAPRPGAGATHEAAPDQPTSAPAKKSAQGRAGKLGSDEF
jgi:serine/threonine protein kinase